MAVTIVKGLLGKEDVRFYSAASPTFYRTSAQGNATPITALAATHIPLTSGSGYFTANNVERASKEVISRYFSIEHSTATYPAGVAVGEHLTVFGFRNAAAATSIQAAASNQFLSDGVARVFVPYGDFTQATPIQLPRRTVLFGNGLGSVIRQNATIQTSRLFSISGQVSGTNSSLSANATIGGSIVSVSNGAKFRTDDWILIRDSKNAELQQVKSVAGNDVTVRGILRHTYRSAATVKNASLVYPAELVMDNLLLQMSSATQGIGIAATYLVHSKIGSGVVIRGHANAGVKLNLSSMQDVDATIENPSSVAAGKGYGVWMTNFSCENTIGGVRQGNTKDVADGGSILNRYKSDRIFRGSYAASGIADPIAYYYRNRKPQLSCVSAIAGAVTILQCEASANAPAEAMIDGQIYRNTSTIVGNQRAQWVSGFAGATTGIFDRFPSLATGPTYVYAVPAQNSSATRQFDLLASKGDPTTGPTASGTHKSWTFLGAVQSTNTGGQISPFTQIGDQFNIPEYLSNSLAILTQPIAAMATHREVTTNRIPVGARTARVMLTGYAATRGTSFSSMLQFNVYSYKQNQLNQEVSLKSFGYGSGLTLRQNLTAVGDVALTSTRRFAYQNISSATIRIDIALQGYNIDRAAFK